MVDHHADRTGSLQTLRQNVRAAAAGAERIHIRRQHEQVLRVFRHTADLQRRADEQHVDVVLLRCRVRCLGVLQELVAVHIVFRSNLKIRGANRWFHIDALLKIRVCI